MIRQGGEGGNTARAELMSLALQVDAINAKILAEAEAKAEAPRVIHCDGCSQRFPRDEMTYHDSESETFALCERCKQCDRAYTDGA
jgi:heterodisulfide reductase subunit B